jgi:hypothetical protein
MTRTPGSITRARPAANCAGWAGPMAIGPTRSSWTPMEASTCIASKAKGPSTTKGTRERSVCWAASPPRPKFPDTMRHKDRSIRGAVMGFTLIRSVDCDHRDPAECSCPRWAMPERALRVSCTNNLRQPGLALAMYAVTTATAFHHGLPRRSSSGPWHHFLFLGLRPLRT